MQASLCGHFELVQLLLESGALAERDTFQGERAVYNALNDKIRNLLLSYDYSKTTDPLQPWSSHITSLLSRNTPNTSDITLMSDPHSLQLHKFLLSARTPYFRKELADAPETTQWKVSHSIPFEASQIVAQYLYLGELPRDVVGPRSSATEEDVFKGLDKIGKQLGVNRLWDAVLSQDDRRLARQRYQDEVNRAQSQVQGFFRQHVIGQKMEIETRKVNDIKWKHDNSIFSDCLLRADYNVEDEGEDDDYDEINIGANGIPIGPVSNSSLADRDLKKRQKSVVFPVHKAMLIRSPYFETMFSSGFLEAQDSDNLHIVQVDCVPEVLEIVLCYLYTEKADIPLDLALEVLYIADMLLMDRLKTKAAVAISTLGSATNDVLVDRTHVSKKEGMPEPVETEPINVYDVIHAAWDLRVQRLEEFAARYLAYRLEDYIDEPEFSELIQESASRIKKREETDTIELLDDIRYYLSERFRLRFQDTDLGEILDEEGEIRAEDVEQLAAESEQRQAAIDQRHEDDRAIAAAYNEGTGAPTPAQTGSVVRTLEGVIVNDEFDLDAQNYQILLRKIDTMLERLKLDA